MRHKITNNRSACNTFIAYYAVVDSSFNTASGIYECMCCVIYLKKYIYIIYI